MRAVVTGGAGFLGSHLCRLLLSKGFEVVCLDNLATGHERNVADLVKQKGFTFVKHDVTKFIQVDGPVDRVWHLASPASPIDYLRLPIQTLKVGSLGTHNALGLALAKKARFFLASTSEVYGDPQVHPQREDYWGHVNPIGPRGVYDEAKRFAEAMTMAYHRFHNVDTGIVRIFNTHGPRIRPNDGRAIPTFIKQALKNEPITVAGDGSQTRSIQYVDDLVEGVVRMAASAHSGPINIGTPHEVSMLQLAESIRDLCDSSSKIAFIPRPEDDPTVRQPDITLAREVLGWEPVVPFEEGLKRTIAWFREQPLD